MSQLIPFFLLLSAFLLLQHQSILAEQIVENVKELENKINSPAQLANFYGKNTELMHLRKKRFFEPITWSLSTILMLIFWNGLLAPFLQAQISLKISVFGWFDEEGCLKRMWNNDFKSFCNPTPEQLFVGEFINQTYMKIFNNVSRETAELIQFEHSQKIHVYEPPNSAANQGESLSERESLFLTMIKNRLLPYGAVKISKWFLADEDKNSQKLYGHLNRVWSNVPSPKECLENINNWEEKKKEGKTITEPHFRILLKCECVRMQGDWTEANRPISVETMKNCHELLELKKILPEKEEENINENNNSDDENEEEEEEKYYTVPLQFEDPKENDLIEKIVQQIKGGRIVKNTEEIVDYERLRKMNEENEKQQIKKAKLRKILLDFLTNFDVKKQIEFLQRLEQNLLALEKREIKTFNKLKNFHKIPKIFFNRSKNPRKSNKVGSDFGENLKERKPRESNSRISTVLYSHPNLSVGREMNVGSDFGEDLEEGRPEENQNQCRINYENYGKNCIIDLKYDLENLDMENLDLKKDEFRKSGIQIYPKHFITLFEKTFEMAKKQFERKMLNISPWIRVHIGKRHLLILFRRISCRIYEFAKEEEEKKNEKLNFYQKLIKNKNGGFKMAKNVMKKFGKLCKKFYERNLKERTELLAIEGFGELDKNGQKINDEIFDKIEIIGPHENAKMEVQDSKIFNSPRASPINERFRHSGLQKNEYEELPSPWLSNKYYTQNGSEENKIGINKTGMIRRKRFAIALTLLGFTASLIFLQIYLRFFNKKYDPITWLWNCMKYPHSRCKIPEAIQNENEFLENAKENARVEMPLETVVEIRKLFEMYLPFLLKIKTLKKILMKPSQFFAKYWVKFNRRHQFLLDCFYYDWKATEKKPENLDNLLAPIIEANKSKCTLFTDFMQKEMIPKELKHILTHCSQIGGNV